MTTTTITNTVLTAAATIINIKSAGEKKPATGRVIF
jgi:hypothetical protein